MPTRPMNVGFQVQSGSNADIAEPSLLTHLGHCSMQSTCLKGAGSVAKVFLHDRPQFFRLVDAAIE